MTWRRFTIVILLAISIAVPVLLVKLPTVLERVAISTLEGLGATEISIKVVDVGLTLAQIGELRFVMERNAWRYTILSHDISLSYILFNAIRGNLNTVNVPNIAVRVESLPSVQDETVKQNFLSPSNWLASIPFKNLNLKQLKFELIDESGRTRYMEIGGKLNVVPHLVRAQFDVKTNDYGTQRVELSLAPTGVSQLALSDMRTASKPFTYITLTSGAWTSAESQLQANVAVDVDVKKLEQQLQHWNLPLIPKGASGQLTAQGTLLLPFNHSPSWQPKGMLALQIPKLKNMGEQVLVDAAFEMTLNKKQLQWHIEKGGQASLKNLQLNETQIKSVKTTLATKMGCAYQIEKKAWSCKPFTLKLTVPSIKNKKNSLTASTGSIAVTTITGINSSWVAGLDVDMPDWAIDIGDNSLAKQLRLDRVYGRIDASNQKFLAKIALAAPGDGATLHINANHIMKDQSGWLQYRLEPIDLQQYGSMFVNTYSDWPAGLLLNAGNIVASGALSWKQGKIRPLQKTTLTLQNVGGAYDEISFSGLTGTMDASGLDELRIKSRQNISMANLNVGAPITDMRVQAELFLRKDAKPIITLDGLAMKVLGGKISGQRMVFDLAREQNPFTLQVSGVNVEKLLKLEQKQGLFGSGIIDGELPMLLTRDGISMQDGQLATRKPGGNLSYSADEGVQGMAESNAGLQLLVTAMKNFNYKLLEVNVDYAPDGLLKMKVRLQGSNPELEGGRSVHLNVDLEDNILELLRSLRLAGEISEKIGEQVEKRQLGK